MPKKPANTAPKSNKSSSKSAGKVSASGPRKGPRDANDPGARKMKGTQALAAAFPSNKAKPSEFGRGSNAPQPAQGQVVAPPDSAVTGSTLSEGTPSDKAGTKATPGLNPANETLDRV